MYKASSSWDANNKEDKMLDEDSNTNWHSGKKNGKADGGWVEISFHKAIVVDKVGVRRHSVCADVNHQNCKRYRYGFHFNYPWGPTSKPWNLAIFRIFSKIGKSIKNLRFYF